MAKKITAGELLAPEPRGHMRDWNFKLEQMPPRGSFEVMRIYGDVYRYDNESLMVIEPTHGRMFRPVAWRKSRRSR